MADVTEEGPQIAGTDIITGNYFDSESAENTGKSITLTFFDYMDDECRSVIECLVDFWNNYAGNTFQIVLVHPETDPDPQHKINVTEWLVNELGVTFPTLYGGNTWLDYLDDIDISERNKPVTFIMDRNKIITKRYYRENHPECNELETNLLDVIVERDPIDLEMVMDVSGSMNNTSPSDPNGLTKFEMMQQAITIIGDYLVENSISTDRMGLIWFTDGVREYHNSTYQRLLPIPANWNPDLRPQVNRDETGTCTAMGSGLQTAFNTLELSNQQGFVILCTDGIQNVNPLVVKVGDHYEIINGEDWCGPPTGIGEYLGVNIADYNTPVYTIGVGITTNYEPLLQDIATQTGAIYRATNRPEDNLDLNYLESLCDSMFGGSPSILYHNINSIAENEHEKEEFFYVNSSIRKITAILTWKKTQGSNFTFWLYNPDGTLLNLHREMRFYEHHCMATVYLPKKQNGEHLKYEGEWRMVIRGELTTTPADYHIFIVGEDTDIKLLVDFPGEHYEVGDLLSIKLVVLKKKKPFAVKPKEISIEMNYMPVPLSELLARYEISVKELLQKMKPITKKAPKNPLILKVIALSTEPEFQKELIPKCKLLSLQEGNLKCNIKKEEVSVQIALEQPGLHSFKINTLYEDPENGFISRTKMFSTIVGPGKIDPKQSSVDILNSKSISIIPRNKKGQLLGPGYSNEFKLQSGKEYFDIEFKDLLNGTYQIELPQSEKEMIKLEERDFEVKILFRGNLIWIGKLGG